MPAIKLKKAAAEHQAEKEREEREREAEMPSVKPKEQKETKETKESKEAKDSSLLRGLDSNILFEKRKRQIVPSEQKVIDWIDANLETKENSHVILQHLYDYFAEACSFDGTPVVSMDVFQRRVFDKFGKFFALKESSPYKGVIKERIGKGKGSQQVKADSLKLKMKDIIEEGLKEAGNPAKGIRFNSLKQYIACNYPALRIDLRPGLLKNSLNKGVTYGYIQLVKGIGMAGFYRLPVDEEPDEEEEKAGEDKSKGKAEQNGDSAEGGEKTEEPKKSEEKKKSRKKKEKEEAKKDGEGEDKEGETEEGKEGEGEEEEAKKKKKKKKSRKPRLDSYGAQPKRMEDIFPLAMTYMAEPKQASYQQIKKYIFEYYPNVDENQFRKSLVKGTNKGYWAPLNEKSVFSSRYDLLLDEFDPNSTDNVDDMICSAIIACSEPKIASCNLLKKYIIEYHPEFNIESRPNLFKMALERGAKKGIIVQISGIGATGSFQLCKVYKPSPVVLAGDEEEVEMDIFKGVKEEVYIPRGTKSRKLVPRAELTETSYRPTQKRKPPTNRNRPSKAKSSRSSSKGKSSSKRGRTAEESDEEEQEEEEQEEEIVEEEEEEDFEPKPKKSKASPKKAKSTPKKGKAKSPAKKGRKPVSRSQLHEDEGEEEEEEEEEVPVIEEKRKKSRAEVEEVKSGRGRSKARPNYADDERESGDDEPKKSRGKKSGGSRRGSRVNYGEEDEDEEEETTEYTPRKSKSRGGEVDESPSPKKSKKRR